MINNKVNLEKIIEYLTWYYYKYRGMDGGVFVSEKIDSLQNSLTNKEKQYLDEKMFAIHIKVKLNQDKYINDIVFYFAFSDVKDTRENLLLRRLCIVDFEDEKKLLTEELKKELQKYEVNLFIPVDENTCELQLNLHKITNEIRNNIKKYRMEF